MYRATRSRLIALASLLAALSMFFASAVDVGASLTVSEAQARAAAAASAPVVMPHEWIWRGREPVSLEFMYADRPQPPADWIRTDHAR
jgi:hypothetical protein